MIEQKYKYQLAKRGKWICPECRRKTFVCYVDDCGNVLDESVGKCDRADNCAHHYTPRQYFEDNKWADVGGYRPRPSRPIFKPQPRPNYINPDDVKKSVKGTLNHRNNLMTFLNRAFIAAWGEDVGNRQTEQTINEYFIGTSKHFGGGATVFYQIDRYGKIHRGKVMQYNPTDGKRVKEPFNMVTTVHKLMKLENQPPQCLFGEHLLKKDPDKTIAIVESEKTAMIAGSMFYDCVFLACGGCGNLTATMCEPLRGRDVILFPDNGKFDEWSEKGRKLRHIFKRLRITDIMEQAATNKGDDIGDYILQHQFDVVEKDFGVLHEL